MKTIRHRFQFHTIAVLVIYTMITAGCVQEDPNTLQIDLANTQITFAGKIYPHRYNTRSDRVKGHHFIVYSGGSNAKKALINTEVPDHQILSGLEALGAVPGNNLTTAAWDERNNPQSDAPDQNVEGTPLDIFVQWEQEYKPAYELFADASPSDFQIRFGGHEELISVWESGCVTCLFSCPGGRTSNAAYTIRDQAKDRQTFMAKEKELPSDGSTVRVIVKPVFDEHQPFEEVSEPSSG